MAGPLLLSIQDGSIAFSGKTVFENLSFNIHQGSKIALVGRNGAGKTTLMNLITGKRELDSGERWVENDITIGYVQQDVQPRPDQTVAEYIGEEIKPEEREYSQYKIDMVTGALHIDPDTLMTRLSGGQLRRAALARALVEEPDVLLLDEPTNHMDLEAIEWLENYLKSYNGTVLCVSHDRYFLANVTDTIFWLDRGRMRVAPKGFAHFDDWSTELLEQEERELKNRKTMAAQEVEWASRGVKARRKRNIRRLELMKEARDKLKSDESAYRRATKTVSFDAPKEVDISGRVVVEFHNVCKSFDETGSRGCSEGTEQSRNQKVILDKFSLKIVRGERIGILGKNGSGKTSFLKMLVGEMEPDAGRIKLSKTAEISYFDQRRKDLKLNETMRRTLIPNGGDYLEVGDKTRHVCGYVKDFMFDPAEIERIVRDLSGGEKNRLLLAKILAKPGNFMVLDEPTNDLDMDTLDMLEEALSHYKGTLFVVSHDRDFLDQTVSKIIAFEGDGKIQMCIGGYSDYLEMIGKKPSMNQNEEKKKTKSKPEIKNETQSSLPAEASTKAGRGQNKNKMTYKLKYELEQLPQKIADAETRVAELNEKLADPDFYTQDPDAFHEATKELADEQARLERYELRWLELDEMASG